MNAEMNYVGSRSVTCKLPNGMDGMMADIVGGGRGCRGLKDKSKYFILQHNIPF